jgi:hypothetical protein
VRGEREVGKMEKISKSAKVFGSLVGLLFGNRISRPIEIEMTKYPYRKYPY